ncbi:MAG TPA: permease-like cell division protein FtsX [Candidatus Paceibacterota bacterium]|nr:permease-like cell division protein FtsX [Candidatus Paceibacterota bacterium]
MLTIIKRIFQTAFKGLKRNSWLTVACIVMLVISTILFTSIIIFNYAANYLVNYLKEKVDISLYFKPEIPEEDILKIRDELLGKEEIVSIDYVSKEEALKKFEERTASNPLIKKALEELGENPLSSSLNIKAKGTQEYQKIVKDIDNSPFKDKLITIDLAENQRVINQIHTLSKTIQLGSIGAMLVLVFISLIIGFNTIRMAIFALHEEVEIMKLVGATPWFIRWPFLLEGTLQGFFASVITLIIFIPLIIWLSPKFEMVFAGFQLAHYFWGNLGFIFLAQTCFSMFLGIISSFLAINKYLKV